MKKYARRDILMIICMLLIFIAFLVGSCNALSVQKGNYTDLEEIAYEISNEKNISFPISEKLTKYDINVNEKNIYIKLYGDSNEYIEAEYTHEYELQSLKRSERYSPIAMMIFIYVCFSVAFGAVGGILLDFSYIGVKKLIEYYSKVKRSRKI